MSWVLKKIKIHHSEDDQEFAWMLFDKTIRYPIVLTQNEIEQIIWKYEEEQRVNDRKLDGSF